MPRLSISLVMPALNAANFISNALDSVAQQVDGNFNLEVVLADGGSTDNTCEIAADYSFVRILEGTDDGIYEGFNRGLEASCGDIIGMLNADDCLAKNTLCLLPPAFAQPATDMISGATSWLEKCQQNGGIVSVNDQPMNIIGLLFGIPAINGRFFRRKVIEKAGVFATDAGLAADRAFLINIYKSGVVGKNVTEVLYHYRVHSDSKTLAGDLASKKRVWQAEKNLIAYLLANKILTKDETEWGKCSYALANLKQFLYGGKKTTPKKFREVAKTLPYLPQALRAWHKWRGRLSGY